MKQYVDTARDFEVISVGIQDEMREDMEVTVVKNVHPALATQNVAVLDSDSVDRFYEKAMSSLYELEKNLTKGL